jgi:replicative DNA helicase
MAGPLRSRRDIEAPDSGASTPPHSTEAEQAVIGGLLIDVQAWDQVGDLIGRRWAELAEEHDDVATECRRGMVAVRARLGLESPTGVRQAGALNYLDAGPRHTDRRQRARAYAQIVRERCSCGA